MREMTTFTSFEEIEAWQKARDLTREIYRISNEAPFSRDFGLCNQIRRACVSVMSNITEGFERSGTKEFVQFLSISKGSIGEVRSHLYIAFDQSYIDNDTFIDLVALATEISRMISGLMNYLRKSHVRGSKYN